MAHEFTDANFEKEVLQADKLVLVDFWAPWCGPCKMLGPIVEKLSTELASTVHIGKLNVDDNPAASQEYDVQGIPTILAFKGGKVVGKSVGFKPEPALRAFIDQHK